MGEQRMVVVVEAERREAAALQHAFADWRVPSPRPGCNPDPPPPPPPAAPFPRSLCTPCLSGGGRPCSGPWQRSDAHVTHGAPAGSLGR